MLPYGLGQGFGTPVAVLVADAVSASPADTARWLLVVNGQLTAPTDQDSWPGFVSEEPPLPDNCVTLYDTTGFDHGSSMVDGELFADHGIQLRVRAGTYAAGYAKAKALRQYIAEQVYNESIEVGGTVYTVVCFSQIGDVLAIGNDRPGSTRELFTINATITVGVVT